MAPKLRILIEWGATNELTSSAEGALPPPPLAEPNVEVSRVRAWATLKDARSRMKNAVESGDTATAEQIAQWIGGGIVSLATMTEEDPKTLLERLTVAVPISTGQVAPQPGDVVKSPDSQARFRVVERERPAPPPGAPKAIDPRDLTPEEREEYGIFLPEEMEAAREDASAGDMG